MLVMTRGQRLIKNEQPLVFFEQKVVLKRQRKRMILIKNKIQKK